MPWDGRSRARRHMTDPDASSSLNASFIIQTLAGKGLGVVASRPLAAGETIIREQPLIRLTPDGNGRFDPKYYGGRDEVRGALLTLAQDVGGVRGDSADAMTKVVETNGIVLAGGA